METKETYGGIQVKQDLNIYLHNRKELFILLLLVLTYQMLQQKQDMAQSLMLHLRSFDGYLGIDIFGKM